MVLSGAAGLFEWVFDTDLLGLLRRLHVGNDASVPTWFASFGLTFCAILAVLHAALDRQAGGPSVIGWLALAAVFTAASIDEVATIHEWSSELVTFDPGVLVGRYTWVVLGIPVLIALAALLGPFILRLPDPTRRRLLVASGVYFIGALVIENVNGHLDEQGYDAAYWLGTHVEEALEFAGAVLAIHAMVYALRRGPILSLELSGGDEAATTP